MRQLLIWTMMLGAGVASAQSLDELHIQTHGYATQGLLYTTQNNIFYADSSDGSPAWSEAVVNVSAAPIPKLHIAAQARYTLLGSSGIVLALDWAAADYKVSERFGVRVGKVKTPWGLFNETQDIDPSYLWSLLPQSVYDLTTRSADLAHYGGVVYGTVQLGAKMGAVDYRGWGGEQVIPTNDGSFADVNDAGAGPTNALSYGVYGGALHWRTPIRGLMIGASDGRSNQSSVALAKGSESFSPSDNECFFAQYERGKVMVAGEWNRQMGTGSLNLRGVAPQSLDFDDRGWYAMATYSVTKKFSAGIYDSQFDDHAQPLGPDRYSKDWVVSGRYDFNRLFYAKAEEHFVDGTALGFENANNPTLQPSSRLSAVKIGISF